MHPSRTADGPQPGDLVLAWSGQYWNISVHPGPPQMHAKDLFTAIEQASPLAEHGKVFLWSTRDGVTFSREPLRAAGGRASAAGSGRR